MVQSVRRWFWPLICSPLLVLGIVAATNGQPSGLASGAGLAAGWAATIGLAREDAREAVSAGPGRDLRRAGWGLLAVVLIMGGLYLGRYLDAR